MNQMTRSAATGQTSDVRPPVWWAYIWWAATGALVSFGVGSLLTIGVFLTPVAIVLIAVGILWAPLRNQATIALIGGIAAAPLYIAWLNRQGPGTVCEPYGYDGTHCWDQWSPWPFISVGLLLIAASIVAAARLRKLSGTGK